MSRRIARAGGLLFAAWCTLVSAQQTGLAVEETPTQLLTRMSNAVHYLDYEGSIVYLREGVMDAVRLSHTEQDGYEREHLIALTGSAHQIVRDNYTVTRFQPGRSAAAVEDRGLNALGSTLLSFDPERVARSYDFEERKAERVAGRITRAVAIIPRDDLRFGYLLHIDAKYALPLKFDVIDGEEPVSQLMFTDIRIRHESPEAILAATEQNSGLVPVPREPDAGDWHFDQLPPGFELEFVEAKDGTKHFVFSDGMATMSVYVENDRSAGLEGQQRLGAFGAYGGEVAGHQVTVVGEMPLESLRTVWAGIRRGAGVSSGG
jgi:sigma-E factor negative regulatory protein RseB